jgi:hypothetical protein
MPSQIDMRERMLEASAPADVESESFEINDLRSFTWFSNKIELNIAKIHDHAKIADDKRKALQKVFNEEMEKIQSDFLAETTEQRATVAFLSQKYGQQAQRWALEHMKTLKGKAKSFKIGRNQFGVRKDADKYQIINNDKVVQWAYAKGLEDMVQVESTVKVDDLKKYQKEHEEEVIDGFRVIEGKDKFYVNADSEDLFKLVGHQWDVAEEIESADTNGNNVQQGEGDDVLQRTVEPDASGRPTGSDEGAEQSV